MKFIWEKSDAVVGRTVLLNNQLFLINYRKRVNGKGRDLCIIKFQEMTSESAVVYRAATKDSLIKQLNKNGYKPAHLNY